MDLIVGGQLYTWYNRGGNIEKEKWQIKTVAALHLRVPVHEMGAVVVRAHMQKEKV
jgi:hypothetical protein